MMVFVSSSTSNTLNIEMIKGIIVMGHSVLLDDETIINNEEELLQFIKLGNNLEICHTCLGKGSITNEIIPESLVTTVCPNCRGTGRHHINSVSDGKLLVIDQLLDNVDNISEKTTFDQMKRIYNKADYFIIVPSNMIAHSYFYTYLKELMRDKSNKLIFIYNINNKYQFFINHINSAIIKEELPKEARNYYYEISSITDLSRLIGNSYTGIMKER